jgi:hypothetical protein
MKRNIKYSGLTERPHYASIVDYLENEQPKTAYPFDRSATILRSSPYFTQLDGETGLDLQDIEERLEKDKLRTILLREQASSTGLIISELKALAKAKAKATATAPTPIAKKGEEWEEGGESEEMIEAAESQEDERRKAMSKLVAAHGLPESPIPEYLITPKQSTPEQVEQAGQELREKLHQKIEGRKTTKESSSSHQKEPKTPTRGRSKDKHASSSSRAQPTPPSPP